MTTQEITSFRGDYFFLSNFFPYPVQYEGITYDCAEGAFQAAKFENKDTRLRFKNLTGKEAKRLGKQICLSPEEIKAWNARRDKVMYDVVKAKFGMDENLAADLIHTHDARLVEGNSWNDTYWGVCNSVGQNKLGKILMKVREEKLNEFRQMYGEPPITAI